MSKDKTTLIEEWVNQYAQPDIKKYLEIDTQPDAETIEALSINDGRVTGVTIEPDYLIIDTASEDHIMIDKNNLMLLCDRVEDAFDEQRTENRYTASEFRGVLNNAFKNIAILNVRYPESTSTIHPAAFIDALMVTLVNLQEK